MSHGFFTIISRDEFTEKLRSFSPLNAHPTPLPESLGRVLAHDMVADHDWPLQDRSCMDGFAVNARDVFGASESNPGYLECTAALAIDKVPDVEIMPGECARIATGGVLPEGTDAVVMVEHTGEMDGTTIEIRKSTPPGDNVMRRGEDAKKGQTALTAGTVIRPQEIGLAAALGFEELPVQHAPRVGILSTGDELIEMHETPRPGQVRDVNSHTVAALVTMAGGEPVNYGIVKDDLDSLVAALEKAIAENDIVLLSGGSSIGVRDLTVEALDSFDHSEILAHGVAISPGKPTILGRANDKPVLGLPGQVTSALVVMHVLILPLIRHLMGDTTSFDDTLRPVREATLARNVASKQGREDYVRVKLERGENGELMAHPILGKSGLLRTMIQADGLAPIPAESEGLYEGQKIQVWTV